jgi:branched-chain amino acid transport system ATP-binding protein
LNILEVKNLRKDFEGLRAVDNVSLAVATGAIIGLIGPNGSGKSTLLNLIDGNFQPTAGQIIFDGHDITDLPAERRFTLGIGRGFQDPALFFQMTALDNALLPVKKQRGENPWYAPWWRTWQQQEQENASHAGTALKRVNLQNDSRKLASDLSGGQMKLLEIARSLMGSPTMLLLDEPTAGVAPKLAYTIFEQIAEMRDALGLTFLIVEHRLEILFDFVDSVYVMHLGSVLAHGTPDEVAANVLVREVYFGE